MNDTEGHADILVCMAGTGGTGFGTASYLRRWAADRRIRERTSWSSSRTTA